MVFLVSLLIGTQILCSLAVSPLHSELSPPPPERFIPTPCNSSSVKAAAELALDKLNADRREGYMLRPQRVFDNYHLRWKGTGDVYYLTLDVLETECHVLSRKSWKDCEFRDAHETVYGQCKATFYINKPWRILHLFNYDCVLHPLPASVIVRVCPDCPTPGDPNEAKFLETAALSLAKYNAESNHTHYFNIRNVTRARSQWVVGPSNFVEYVIQETSCSKSQAVSDLSACPFLPDERADVGVCKGSVIDSRIEHRQFITASCDIFHPQPLVTEGQQAGHRKPGHREDDESHEDHGHSRHVGEGHHKPPHHQHVGEGHHKPPHHQHVGEGHHKPPHHRHDRHHHRHHGHHKNRSHDHAEHAQTPPSSETLETSTHLPKTVGRVQVFPSSRTHVSLHSLPEIEAERLDGEPVPPESQRPKPEVNRPDIYSAPEERPPLGKPGLTKPARPVTPPPFPAGFSHSDSCPGEILINIPGLEPLLPKRPAEASPTTGATEFQAKEYVKP